MKIEAWITYVFIEVSDGSGGYRRCPRLLPGSLLARNGYGVRDGGRKVLEAGARVLSIGCKRLMRRGLWLGQGIPRDAPDGLSKFGRVIEANA